METGVVMRDERPDRQSASIWRRLGWFVVLWLASVSVIGLVAAILRLWIGG